MRSIAQRGSTLAFILSVVGCGAPDSRPALPEEAGDRPTPDRATTETQATPASLDCVFGGVQEQRYRRNCEEELGRLGGQESTLDEQIASLGSETVAPVRAALTSLVDQRRQLCHDWNACALGRDDHMNRYDWVNDELATLAQLLSDSIGSPTTRQTALTTWAGGLQNRRPATGISTSQTSPTDMAAKNANNETQNPGAAPQIPPQLVQNAEMLAATAKAQAESQRRLRVSIKQQERELVELNAYRDIVQKLRAASTPPTQNTTPPLCKKIGPTRAQLTELVRGSNSLVNSLSRNVLDGVNDLCGPYELWAQPDERIKGQIGRLFANIDRIDNWMTEILACINPGPYDYPCQNAYGPLEPGDEAQCRKTQRILKQVRQELRGVKNGQRRFPCGAPLWQKLQQQQWNESVSRAQMPGLGRSAERVCEAIGLDQEGLAKAQENFTRRLDSSESSASAHIRSREETLSQLRLYVH